ncbi:hypothetical protein GCM10027168_69900 [Streptomyces capparidis]
MGSSDGERRHPRHPTTPAVPGKATEHAPVDRPPSGPAPHPRGDRDRVEDTDLAAVEGTRLRLAALTADTNRRIRQCPGLHRTHPPRPPRRARLRE